MSKRRPGNQLTQDNWDEADEEQEAGTFNVASADALKGRQIKKAKRRGLTGSSDTTEEGSSAFKAFTGFGGFGAATGGLKPNFSFNINAPKEAAKPHANGTKSDSMDSIAKTGPSKSSSDTSKDDDDRSQYLNQLKALNESVSKWIQTHVHKNPFCILTPIFKDYETHLSTLEKIDPEKNGESKKDSERGDATQQTEEVKATTEDEPKPSKSSENVEVAPAAAPEKPSFSFGSAANSSSKPTVGFTFGTAATGSSGSSIFGAGALGGGGASASGFTFGAAAKPDEDEEYVPPTDNVKTVVEEDAFYTKRCKLFFKKGDTWQDRGLGNLHLKPCGTKTQLLIRADTNLGNILLNVMITHSIPANRQGKNNVMIVCVPNPPLDEKSAGEQTAVSMLIRVKTSADADELFEKLENAKNST